MSEQEVKYRHKEQSHKSESYQAMLISNKRPQAVQLFEAISQKNFDICYSKFIDDTLISAVKPHIVVIDFDARDIGREAQQLSIYLQQKIANIQSYKIPIVLLLEEIDYLVLAPIELDYVTPLIWPSTHDQLLSQMYRLAEEHTRYSKYEDGLVFKDLVVDTKRMLIKQNHQRVELTKTEYDLLVFFLESGGLVQTREYLLERIWQLQLFEGSNIVDVHIKSLRRKLNDSAVDPKYIATVRGVGYRLADS